jgi:hypothetical protein
MTVFGDSITAAQRIKLDHPPADNEEQALVQDLKDRGYSWKGYGEKGSWFGDKDTVDMWLDPIFRARVKKNVVGLSFYDTEGAPLSLSAYVAHINAFDPAACDDNLNEMPASTVAPTAPATPAAGSSSSTPPKRARS